MKMPLGGDEPNLTEADVTEFNSDEKTGGQTDIVKSKIQPFTNVVCSTNEELISVFLKRRLNLK
jgi:hypothetical protein